MVTAAGYSDPKFAKEHWAISHDAAWRRVLLPVAGAMHETCMVAMLKGWRDYAREHETQFDSKIGDDGFLGPQWLQLGKALRALLNGETGRLDCGTVDGFILDTLQAHGFSEEDL